MPSHNPERLLALIDDTVREMAMRPGGVTRYREPIVGVAPAGDPRFADLGRIVDPGVLTPAQLLPKARSVVSFFLPFAEEVVAANRETRESVAREWAIAYVETNKLLSEIASRLVERLAEFSVEVVADPPTGRFDREQFFAPLPHKSAAVIAGIGSLGVHSMVITDSGCAGRLNTVVVDVELLATASPSTLTEPGASNAGGGRSADQVRCAYLRDGSCLECVARCPIGALRSEQPLNKRSCWVRCQTIARRFEKIGKAEVCGKCAVGRCALSSG